MSFLTSRSTTISASIVIAMILIVGAYIASGRHIPVLSVNAESSEEILREYASKDSDSDGLPDWEEALYGTDPEDANSVRGDLTDSQAVAQGLATPRYAGQENTTAPKSDVFIPGETPVANSLTEQFSQLFFANYVGTRGSVQPSEEETQEFVASAIDDLIKARSYVDAYSASSVKIVDDSAGSYAAYAVQAESAFDTYSVRLPYSETVYFSDAVLRDDPEAVKNVQAISKSYTDVAAAISKIGVPEGAAAAHLDLVNSMAHLGNVIDDLSSLKEDPIRSMLGLGSYESAVIDFATALKNLSNAYAAAGVSIPVGTPGDSFYYLITIAAPPAV